MIVVVHTLFELIHPADIRARFGRAVLGYREVMFSLLTTAGSEPMSLMPHVEEASLTDDAFVGASTSGCPWITYTPKLWLRYPNAAGKF